MRRKTQRIDDAKKKIQIDVVFWVLKSLWVVVKKEVPKPEIVAAAVVVAGGGGGGAEGGKSLCYCVICNGER